MAESNESKAPTQREAEAALTKAQRAVDDYDAETARLAAKRQAKRAELGDTLHAARLAEARARRTEATRALTVGAERVRAMGTDELDRFTLIYGENVVGTCDVGAERLIVPQDVFEREDRRRGQLLRAARRQAWARHCLAVKEYYEAAEKTHVGTFFGQLRRGLADLLPANIAEGEPRHVEPQWRDIAEGTAVVDHEEMATVEKALNVQVILPPFQIPAGGIVTCVA